MGPARERIRYMHKEDQIELEAYINGQISLMELMKRAEINAVDRYKRYKEQVNLCLKCKQKIRADSSFLVGTSANPNEKITIYPKKTKN